MLIAFMLGTSLAQPIQTFLQIGSIQGESEVAKHKGDIEALAFTSGVEMPLEPHGGATSAKPQFFEIHVSKNIDKASPLLFVNCAIGKQFPTATLSVARVGEKSVVDFFKITLSNVAITRVETTGSVGKGGALTEMISLSFTRIRWTYISEDAKGNPVIVTGGYDLEKNAAL